jgi:hypothetical protein
MGQQESEQPLAGAGVMTSPPDADQQECEVPLTEQLRSIPKDYRTCRAIQWSDDGLETGHQFIPVGYMMHRAADEIDRLRATPPRNEPEYGPCSCQEFGKCRYVNGGPACMNDESQPFVQNDTQRSSGDGGTTKTEGGK